MRTPFRVFAGVFGLILLSSTCGADPTVEAAAVSTPFDSGPCEGKFIAHELDHITKGPGNTASTFDGTGAGVALGDLDDDGDIDIVLPNLFNETTVLENTGGLEFTRHVLVEGRFRGAAVVDAVGDDLNDIVLTTGIGPPVVFENLAAFEFDRGQLPDVDAATYSMAWDDLGGDGDLDLVTGSYNAELAIIRNTPVLGSDTGVVLHEQTNDGFEVTRLAERAQALALITADVDTDGDTDIVVGNDLSTPDGIWLDEDGTFVEATPFATTSYSTMSYDAADIDNDGANEFFSTDMKPPSPDDRYREVDADMAAMPVVDEVQTPRNALSDQTSDGWVEMAEGQSIDATGWSWSGLFGDLDNDGWQDLYVANGMRSDQLFDFLPDARLVEQNRAFQNVKGGFVIADDWGLAATEGGRGMAMADLDLDGDLDIVINNLDEPATLFENRVCGGGSILVTLDWTGKANSSAFGAVVTATDGDSTWSRTITSSRGYLSAGAPVAHIGVGESSSVQVTVDWPDGARSVHDGVASNSHLRITR